MFRLLPSLVSFFLLLSVSWQPLSCYISFFPSACLPPCPHFSCLFFKFILVSLPLLHHFSFSSSSFLIFIIIIFLIISFFCYSFFSPLFSSSHINSPPAPPPHLPPYFLTFVHSLFAALSILFTSFTYYVLKGKPFMPQGVLKTYFDYLYFS